VARIGFDPDFPNLTGWLDPLACLSEARVAASVAVLRGTETERRDRAIAVVLGKMRAGATSVIRVDFRRPAVTITRAAAADSPPEWDDASGEEVYRSATVSVRVREKDTDDGSVIAIRIVAGEGSGADLANTVQVTGTGLRVRHVESTRFYWLGLFDGAGVVDVHLGAGEHFQLEIRRQGGA
jgi:hypothetical protein